MTSGCIKCFNKSSFQLNEPLNSFELICKDLRGRTLCEAPRRTAEFSAFSLWLSRFLLVIFRIDSL